MSVIAPQGDVFDVFISYHASNKDWVTKELLKHLEEEAFSVCWDDRDFEPGRTIIENKLNALCSSTCTVVVLTTHYTTDEDLWPTLIEKCNVKKQEILREFNLVPILLEECKVSDIFSPLWKLDWTNKIARRFFWTKLIQTVRRITERNIQKGALECKHNTTHNSFPATKEVGPGKNDRNTGKDDSELGITDVPNKRRSINGDLQENVRTLAIQYAFEDICNGHVKKENHKDKKHFENDGVTFTLKENVSDNIPDIYDDGLQNGKKSTPFVDSTQLDVVNNLRSVGCRKSINAVDVDAVTSAKSHSDLNATRMDHDKESSVEKNILVQQYSNGSSSDGAENELLEKIHPRIIGLFVPEDDDLTREDIEELTFKVEDVFLDDINASIALESKKTNHHENCISSKDSFEMNTYHRFNSQQEQILVLDFLQGQEIWIREKFENCSEKGRKRIYRRLLERFDKAICSTVNGRKDSELLGSLLASDLFLAENRDCSCSCCDQLFHSERALQLHMVDCVDRSWRSILANSTLH